MENLKKNEALLDGDLFKFCKIVCEELGQDHIFDSWPDLGIKDKEKKLAACQLRTLDSQYPGGLKQYVSNAKKLLKASKDGANPFDGYIPTVPRGERVPLSSKDLHHFCENEAIGLKEVENTCFVLVAGGLGERLGFSGIKVALSGEVITNRCFLEMYIESILALQNKVNEGKRSDVRLPLAIMTSDDTHSKTLELIESNGYFGMEKDQITLIKQEKVPAMIDDEARFDFNKNTLEIDTKPHGHGDVHSLLFSSGLIKRWSEENKKYVVFLQDTNILVFRGVLSALGVSKKMNFMMNSLTVPRNNGEAVGAICKLVNKKEKFELTTNVEYNQLDPLLKSTNVTFPVIDGDEKRSPFPGNINVLIFRFAEYAKILEITKGGVPEFVNPKYADASKTKFKSPTRLECMMQDFPRLTIIPEVAKAISQDKLQIGFTELDRFTAFSAAKNNLVDAAMKLETTGYAESLASCEEDFYSHARKVLNIIGVQVEEGARIVLKPSFGVSVAEIKSHFKSPNLVKISERSSLVLEGNVNITELELDGHLELLASKGGEIIVEKLVEMNEGVKFVEINEREKDSFPDEVRVRGYVLNKAKNFRQIVATSGEREEICDDSTDSKKNFNGFL